MELQEKLFSVMVASCTCGTKTPLHSQHDELCTYRVLNEALDRIDILESHVSRIKRLARGGTAIGSTSELLLYAHKILADYHGEDETLEFMKALKERADMLDCIERM